MAIWLSWCTLPRDETLAAINTVVVNEEINRRKKKCESAFDSVTDRKAYWNQWKEDRELFITNTSGIKGGPAKNSSSVTSLLPHLPARVCSTPCRRWYYTQMEHLHCLANTLCLLLIRPRPMPTCPALQSGFYMGMKTSRTGRCSGSLLQGYTPPSIAQM